MLRSLAKRLGLKLTVSSTLVFVPPTPLTLSCHVRMADQRYWVGSPTLTACEKQICPGNSFKPENITLAIPQLRKDGRVPVFDNKTFHGGQCCVYKVTFCDGESWAVRVPLFIRNTSQESVTRVLADEVRVLQELEAKGFAWAARHCVSDLTFTNPVCYPFVALTWIPGTPLSWTATFPSRIQRDKILRQMAHIQASLIECTQEKR